MRAIVTVCLIFLALPAGAGEALDRLQAFVRDVQGVQAEFHQTLFDPNRERVQESKGRVVLQRPGKFRWDYEDPYPQLIVSDGRKIWVYDADLEQVTIKPAADALRNAPSLVLSGDQPLEEAFHITEQKPRDGFQWVQLAPKDEDTDFKLLRLGFDTELAVMELEDNFGQITHLRFLALRRNPSIDPSQFTFEVPAGVDVVGE